jgi:hypothetical protein
MARKKSSSDQLDFLRRLARRRSSLAVTAARDETANRPDMVQAKADTTNRRPKGQRQVTGDADYIADLEQSDGQRHKRMAARARGEKVKRPRPR